MHRDHTPNVDEPMTSTHDIHRRITDYLSAISTGSSAQIAALYADDATLEDPVGSGPTTGRAAIEQFYSALDGADRDAELIAARISGHAAAFSIRVTTRAPEQTIVIEPIDVMTFDDDGAITSMRAYWSPQDIVITERTAGTSPKRKDGHHDH